MTGGGRGPSEESRVRDTLKDPHGLQGCQLVQENRNCSALHISSK